MVTVQNLTGHPKAFSLGKGETFRLMSFEAKTLESEKITPEMERNQAIGVLSIEKVLKKKTTKKVKKEE